MLAWLRRRWAPPAAEPPAAGPPTQDVADTRTRFQRMESFGASDCWVVPALPADSPVARAAATLLFDVRRGAGLSCWRVNIGAGKQRVSIDDPLRSRECFELAPGIYDWSADANAQSILRRAMELGLASVVLFSNSPPMRLTRNGLTNCDDDQSTTNLTPDAAQAFARFLADVAQHFVEAGVPVTALSPINEPQWRWLGGQEGCRYANADVIQVVTATREALSARGLGNEMLATPDSGSLPDMWQLNANADEAAGGAAYGDYAHALPGCVGEALITYHSYWSDDIDSTLVQHRARLAQCVSASWRLWQTEYCAMTDDPEDADCDDKRALGMGGGLRLSRIMWADLAIAGACSWSWWLGVSCYNFADGLVYVPSPVSGTECVAPDAPVTPSKRLWVMAQYARFVRSGYTRVAVSAQDGAGGITADIRLVMAVAFISPDGRTLVVVYTNAGDCAAVRQLRVEGMEGTAVAIQCWVTDATRDCQPEVVRGPLNEVFTLPPRSVVTFVLTGVT